jgi:hypothetical protein
LNLLKPHNKPYKLFIYLLVICFFLFPRNRDYYLNIKNHAYDVIESNLNGFSSWGSITELDKNPINKIINFIKNKSRDIFHNNTNNIETIHLEVKFKNFKKLLKERENSVRNNIGYDFTEVKGKISFQGKKMNCKVRLKGDLSEHWRSEKRMSFRIGLKGDNSIMSFKRFSIQKPSSRQHPYDQTFQDLQKELGNISPIHNYINLKVNGEDWGIMNIEEHMSKELLEKQKRKESLIIKLGDEKDWRYRLSSKSSLYDEYRLSDEYLNVGVYQEKKYLIDSVYRKYYSYISNQILKKENQIFDNVSFSKSLILSLIWNDTHTLFSSNSRYYFNPYDLKIYPITTDQGDISSYKDRLSIPKPYEKIINSPYFSNNYINNFETVEYSIKKSQKIIDKWQSYFPLDEKISTSFLYHNLNYFENYNKFKENTLLFSESEERKNHKKITRDQSSKLFDHIHAKHYDNGEIHIFNLLNEKIKIKSICVEDRLIEDFKNLEVGGHNFKYIPKNIKTSLTGNFDKKIEIQTEINGFQRLFTLGYTLTQNNIKNPLLEKTNPNDFEFLSIKDDNTYFIKKGNWDINVPIVLDNGLEIEKGTILNFNKESYLIVNGKLTSIGTEDKKIVFKTSQGFWKGVYVLNSREKSIVENTEFFNVTNLSDGLLSLTGSVSFYKSDVELKNVKFINNSSEDFLNIIESNYLIENVLFENCPSDAFDSDFSNGIISNSIFKNISGDGVDFSGSSVKLYNSFFYNVKDKSVSVGEGSSLDVKSIYVENSGVGVAVKDGSNAEVINSTFKNIFLNPLMTYTKKSFYSIPKLTSIDNFFEDPNNCCLRQTESELINNLIIVPEKLFNVDSLYQTQIMKK